MHSSSLTLKENVLDVIKTLKMVYGKPSRLNRTLMKKFGICPHQGRQSIAEYETKGYAHVASLDELSSVEIENTFCLPLGMIRNLKKN